jgi:lipid II:glycine glycyltransferase (peptidoglycan interpeptide bridge formation enzyme)
VDDVGPLEWAAVVQRFQDATIYQTWTYEAVRWGERRTSRLLLRDDGRTVAAAQLRILKPPLLPCGIAYLYRGPLWRLRGRARDPEILRRTLRALRQEYVERRGLLLRIVPNEPEDDTCDLAALLESEGFQRTPAKPYRTFCLDLSPSLEELRKGLRHQWRTNLNKACARPFEFVEGVDDALYEEFLGLYREMHARKRFQRFVDVDEFRRIQQQLPDALKMRIALCRLDGEALAALVFSTLGETALNIFLATSGKALEVQAAFRLLWEQLRWLKERKVRQIDLGGIDPDANPGGYRFKQGLGGRDISHIGTFEACDNPVSRIGVRAAESLRNQYRASRRG